MRRRSRSRRKKSRSKRRQRRKRSLRGGDISRKAMKSYTTPMSTVTYDFNYYYDIAYQLMYVLYTEWKQMTVQHRKRDLERLNIFANDLEYLVTTRYEKDLYDTIRRRVSILNKYSKLSK